MKSRFRAGHIMAAFFIMGIALFGILLTGCGGGGSTAVPTATTVSGEVSRQTYSPPHNRPGPAVDRIEFFSAGVDQAANEVRAKGMDMYIFGLKVTAAKKLEGDNGVKIYRSPSSSVSLLLNPAPDPRGLNPFSILEVRQAMNYLVDRNFIAQEIYGGFAEPMLSHVSPSDPDYVTVAEEVLNRGISYDFDYAKSLIDSAMRAHGAELVEGVWHYNSKPVRVKFVIRNEDERNEIGNVVAKALRNVGFEVQETYRDFAAAISMVYSSDPQSFEWHIYTEGWGRGSADRYDFANINSMSAPWMGNMPGWLISGFWQYENDELDRLGKQIFTGSFSSRKERDQIYRNMTSLALDDAVRVWVATIYTTFPAQTCLTGVTEDLVSGPKSILSMREAYCAGADALRVGSLWIWTERSTWNPIGGFGDVYSIDVWKNMVDPPMITHPFSGLPMPFRASYEVETSERGGAMAVAEGAVVWNAKDDRWEPVPSGAQARSKVVFDYTKYFQAKWHHGAEITMDDVLYELYQQFESTYDEKRSQVEFVLSATRKPILDVFKGFRVVDENRLEVYLDFWHFDENYIASYANIVSLSMPWEVLAAMDKLVYEDRIAAYSQSTAARYNVPWISLVMKRDAGLVARVLRQFRDSSYYPTHVMLHFETSADAAGRFTAALDWFQRYGHLAISQGPFMLTRYDPPGQYAELQAFRDESYPFKPGDWFMGKAERLKIVEPAGTIELKKGERLDVRIAAEGPGRVETKYFVYDPVARKVVDRIDNFSGNILQLYIFAYSDELAQVTQKRVDVLIVR